MKKYIYSIFVAIAALSMTTSCSEDEGSNPGSDSGSMVTVYTYDAELPYNSDNDVKVRLSCNNKVSEVYYMAIPKEGDSMMSEDAMIETVVANGQKAELTDDKFSGGKEFSSIIEGLQGENVIAVVAVAGSKKLLKTVNFKGLKWEDVCEGTYYFNAKAAGIFGESVETKLQKCTNEPGLYRFTDVFGKGYNVKFKLNGVSDTDKYGNFSNFTVAAQPTPATDGSNGTISFRDVSTWTADESYAVNNQFYDYNEVYIWMQYFSAKSLGYGYDFFIPNE